ncbi:MAG: TIGR04076 family protein, partial [Selenomonadaceae bacterium]|nr:TIGR04076 family protein [Selenomonadaceae bacterium]
ALQGGSIMRGWTNDEHMMIACCNDGTRPVIFRIERLDYKVVYVDAPADVQKKIAAEIKNLDDVTDAFYRADKNFIEVFMDRNREVPDEKIISVSDKIVRID